MLPFHKVNWHVTSHNPDHPHMRLTPSSRPNEDTCNPELKHWTPKFNTKPKCDALQPWLLYLDFPSAPVFLLLSYCFSCPLIVYLVVLLLFMIWTPCLIVLLLFHCKCTSLCYFHLVSCLVSLKTIKSQCHVTIPQFVYWNNLTLASIQLRKCAHSDSCLLHLFLESQTSLLYSEPQTLVQINLR